MEIQYNCTMYCIGLYFEIIGILIDKELRNLTSSKLLKFIMQDLSKIETCMISLQEATNHRLLLQLNIFKRIQSTQVSLEVTPKKTKHTAPWQVSEDSFKMYKLFFFFSVDILNIETFISITNIPPVWKTRDGLTVLQTLRTCTSTVFFFPPLQWHSKLRKTWEISTRHGKQKQFSYHAPRS